MPHSSLELQEAIIQQVASVPAGKVCTYGGIAKAIGYPSHSRYVGSVLKKLPPDTKIPWHRILNSQGKSSFPIESAAYREQVRRLEEEGIPFLNGKVARTHMIRF